MTNKVGAISHSRTSISAGSPFSGAFLTAGRYGTYSEAQSSDESKWGHVSEETRRERPFVLRRDPANPDTYRDSLLVAQRELRACDPAAVAWRADVLRCQIDRRGEGFIVPYFGRAYVVSWPDGRAWEQVTEKPASQATHVLLLHYLLHADGAPLTGEWVSFRQLPDGLGYFGAFHQRSERPLAERFGKDIDGFIRAAEALEGERWRMAEISYGFKAFPRMPLAVLLWRADEEFPASASILFDGAAGHYLPTEDLSAVGGTVSSRLLRWKP